MLGAADFADHRWNQRRLRNQVRLDILDHRRLIHVLGSPTIRHRRTGVAIYRLVSGEKDGPSLLQGGD
ncbi:MAG TPA: hypothetical protein VFX03_09645, partial [Thermomicrobiales bacterium]|nr:hypothetical protein [Thermomicrobiales bacterium]